MSNKVYVGNLPFKYRNEDLNELFSEFGRVEDAVIIFDRTTRRSKGFGFVTFINDGDAEKAISEMSGKVVEGRPLTVNEARPREDSRGNRKESSSGKNVLNEPEENVTSQEIREKPEDVF
jgi:cold-inducible RNA-binding protein